VPRRYYDCSLDGKKFFLQSLDSEEWLKASSHDNYLMMAGCMALVDGDGVTQYAATDSGIQELMREFCEDDAGFIHQFREIIAEHVFRAGAEKKCSQIGSLPGSASAEPSAEPTGGDSSTS
jgi:hypothetical protein